MKKKSHWIQITFGIVCIIVASLIIIFVTATRPFSQVKDNALKVIQKKTSIRDFSKYYWYNHNGSFFSTLGRNSKGVDQYAIVNIDNGNVTIVNRSAGLSEQQVRDRVSSNNTEIKKIDSIRLGIYKKQVVWEAVFESSNNKLNYFTIRFKDGKILQKITDI